MSFRVTLYDGILNLASVVRRLNCSYLMCCIYNLPFCCRVTAVDGQYQIGIYAVRPIEYGEEITFDYNSVTEVCLDLSDFLIPEENFANCFLIIFKVLCATYVTE